MIVIIVPFADFLPEEERTKELDLFLQHMRVHVPLIYEENVYIIIAEQVTPKTFNRGQILNIGAIKSRELAGGEDTIIVTHDVDILPDDSVLEQYDIDEKCDSESFMIKDETLKKLYEFDDIPIGGGITATRRSIFFAANGYPNNFWAWGSEDYLYSDRLKRMRARVCRATKGKLIHIDTLRLKGEKKEHLRKHKLKNMVAREMRRNDAKTWRNNGVNSLRDFKIIDEQTEITRNLTVVHIKLELWEIDYENVRAASEAVYKKINRT